MWRRGIIRSWRRFIGINNCAFALFATWRLVGQLRWLLGWISLAPLPVIPPIPVPGRVVGIGFGHRSPSRSGFDRPIRATIRPCFLLRSTLATVMELYNKKSKHYCPLRDGAFNCGSATLAIGRRSSPWATTHNTQYSNCSRSSTPGLGADESQSLDPA